MIEDDYLRIASIPDIACMKLSAIISRATNKDYLDIYFILQKYNLGQLLKFAKKKFTDLDQSLILKNLVYFSDITTEPIIFKTDEVEWNKVKDFLKKEVLKIKP